MIFEIIIVFMIFLMFLLYYNNYYFEYYDNQNNNYYFEYDNDNKNDNQNKPEMIDINNYKKMMLNNDKKKLYKVGLSKNIPIYTEDCNEKCDATKCTMLNEKTKSLKKCMQCNSQKYKCFKNDIESLTGGSCEDCDIENINDKLDCYSTDNYGCPNPTDLNSINGIRPYYIQISDNSPVSPYNQKCVFCSNILDQL